LGLAIEAVTDAGEVVSFGKDEDRVRRPRLGTGLLGLARTRASFDTHQPVW
jgi:DNA-directed RNA polymerase subunit beta